MSNLIHRFICVSLKISSIHVLFFFCQAGIGGPLIDFDGNFVGINFYGTKETHYLPRLMIQRLLKDFDGYVFHIFCSFFWYMIISASVIHLDFIFFR